MQCFLVYLILFTLLDGEIQKTYIKAIYTLNKSFSTIIQLSMDYVKYESVSHNVFIPTMSLNVFYRLGKEFVLCVSNLINHTHLSLKNYVTNLKVCLKTYLSQQVCHKMNLQINQPFWFWWAHTFHSKELRKKYESVLLNMGWCGVKYQLRIWWFIIKQIIHSAECCKRINWRCHSWGCVVMHISCTQWYVLACP